jgi:uncharacterized membrane-anchored protein YjiN (DUF445 family)
MQHNDIITLSQISSLKRIKWLASGLLFTCIILLIFAKILERQYPAFGFVAAFAEAATIGGFADWYAIVALFRHPLGIPIPHTAIIAKNQDRIATSLARFIGTNFLEKQAVSQKIQEIDFSRHISNWLADTTHTKALLGFIMNFLPQIMQKADSSGLKLALTNRMKVAVSQANITPFVSNVLSGLSSTKHHQKLLDGVLTALGNLIVQPSSIEAISHKIKQELPSVFTFFKADAYLLRRIIGSLAKLIDDVQADDKHPLRAEVDGLFDNFLNQLKTSSDYHEWLDTLKLSLLNRPETAQLFQGVWDHLQSFIENDAMQDDSVIKQQIQSFIAVIVQQLSHDEQLRKNVNTTIGNAFETIIISQKDTIALFISNQVKAWDAVHMTKMIENSVGRDLQYIRFNGTLIGGAIGVILYSVQLFFGLK